MIWLAVLPEWVTAELADVRYWQAMERYAAAMVADDMEAAAEALLEVFQQLEEFNDDVNTWSMARAAMPETIAWRAN